MIRDRNKQTYDDSIENKWKEFQAEGWHTYICSFYNVILMENGLGRSKNEHRETSQEGFR